MIGTEFIKGQGLGNQLFCYVTARSIAEENGYEFGTAGQEVFANNIHNDKGMYFMDVDLGHAITQEEKKSFQVCQEKEERLFIGNSRHDMEHGCYVSGRDDAVCRVADNTLLYGNLQDESYFIHCKEKMKQWLCVKPEYDSYEYSRENLCIINMRGGEYTGSPELFLDRSYWLNGIKEMKRRRPDMEFMIITDDVEAAGKILPGIPAHHFDIGKDYVTLKNACYLLLSNSSFACLPAHTSETLKFAIAPKYWARHNVSDGYWASEQNIYSLFYYMDRRGRLFSAKECRQELEQYKKTSRKYRKKNRKPGRAETLFQQLRSRQVYLWFYLKKLQRAAVRRGGKLLQSGMTALSERIDRIPVRRMNAYAAFLLFLSLLPLLLLGKYNVMCMDDYDFGRRVHETYLATGSLWQSVQTAAIQAAERYIAWQGTYASCFLMGLAPMNFRYGSAFLVPIMMIGMFVLATYLFGRQILVRWLGSDRQRASFVMLLLIFMFYQVMGAPFEGIYWYNGSIHYVMMEALAFLILTLVSGIIWTEKKSRAVLWCVTACLLAVLVGGGNQVTLLQAAILLCLLLGYTCRAARKKLPYVLCVFLVFLAGFLCNILTPGNRVRADAGDGYSPIFAIVLSFHYAVMFAIEWTSLFVVLIWLALLPVLWRIAKRSEKSFAHPVWITAGTVCIYAAMFTPTLFGLGMAGLSRINDIIQMVYYLGLFFVTLYWFGWISHREQAAGAGQYAEPEPSTGQEQSAKPEREISAGLRFGLFLESTKNRMTAVCVFLVLAVWILTANKNTYTSVSALRSLVNGDAETYYAEAMERYAVYTDETVRDAVVKPYSAVPALFRFEDLSEEEDYWINLSVRWYFDKDSVKKDIDR